ncbi:protein lifeguard 3-like isoform X8 [Dreissena polymorpha]|uniref:protein lifeguard 3-like isoform X8 n=1 Tax=Dreissena polymorpha TaxID=45954 RepID=UPI002264D72C|nr:protein lifeguard 3-like isoform X8 [Dreissena polymorpha]
MTSKNVPPPSYSDVGAYPPDQGFVQGQPPVQGYPQGYSNQPYGYNQPPGYGPNNPSQGYNMSPPANEHHDVPKHDDVEGPVLFDSNSFSDKAVRRGFIRKVYLILFTQLLITFGCVCLFTFTKEIKGFVQSSNGSIVYYVSYGTFLVTYIVLICIPSVRRKSPGNFICLGLFTLVFTYMVATISSFYETKSVLVAAGITGLVCLSLSLFAIQTKIDFTMCSGLLFALCMVLLFFGLSCIIVYATSGPNYILHCVYGGLAALLFSLFLIYDTQMIVGGRKHELSPEEYVYGALQLYLDVVYLFLIILSLFGSKN